MKEKDVTEKILADYNDIFADIVNVLLFNGTEAVKEDDLESQSVVSMYKADGKIHEQERDVSKIWKNGEVKISIFGLEHQTKIDPKMPLRVIGYDGASYRAQCIGEGKAFYPVITMVLNFSADEWDRKTKLSDCFDVPSELLSYFSDYKINVFNIAYLSDEQVAMFKSDFRIVADYFVQIRKNNSYVPSKDTIKHVDEILKLMAVLNNDTRFEEVINSGKKVENMCQVLDIVEARGKAEGMVLGEVKTLYLRVKMTPSQIAEEMRLSLEEVEAMISVITKDN